MNLHSLYQNKYTQAGGHRDIKISTSDFEEIKEYIPSFNNKYKEKFVIKDDELLYTSKVTEVEKIYLSNLNIKRDFNYIQDGLVLYLDGINNTRNGHSDTTNIWEDLSGNNNDYTLNNVEILKNSIKFLGNSDSYANLNNNVIDIFGDTLFSERTVELVIKPYITDVGVVLSGSEIAIGIYRSKVITTISGINRYTFDLDNVTNLSSYSVKYTKDSVLLKRDNVSIQSGSADYWESSKTLVSYIGKRPSGSLPYNGEVMAIRVYNRVLTDEEIENNFKIDKIRYGIN